KQELGVAAEGEPHGTSGLRAGGEKRRSLEPGRAEQEQDVDVVSPQDRATARRSTADQPGDTLRNVTLLPHLVHDPGGQSLPFEPMTKGLRKRTDDHRLAYLGTPGTEVPPLDVAGVKPVLGGAAIGLVAVDEVEPVPSPGERPFEAVDRLDEASCVTGLDIRGAVERLHCGQACGNLPLEQDVCAAVARDPQGRAAAALAAAARQGRDGEDESQSPQGSAFERTAPSRVARTSRPRCGPMHPTAACVDPWVCTLRLPTCSTAPRAADSSPLSSWAWTR